MKIITIGDIHGRVRWKEVLESEAVWDKVVFLGDYFDAWDDFTPADQLYNFLEIAKFKRDNPDKVVLLFGNHDYHYMPGVKDFYSGYQATARFHFQNALDDNRDSIQACYKWENYLFTHAGVTTVWWKNLIDWIGGRGIDVEGMEVDEVINLAFKFNPQVFKFTDGRYFDPYGNEVCQTPIWVRPEALMKARLGDYFHVVGHTFGDPEVLTDGNPGGVIKIDALSLGYYLVIEGGVHTIKRLKRG
jgi:hypothetical protein